MENKIFAFPRPRNISVFVSFKSGPDLRKYYASAFVFSHLKSLSDSLSESMILCCPGGIN
jgi:hypothetical protein